MRHHRRYLSMRHYDVLGINSDALQAEVKYAYFQKAKAYHPDMNKAASAAQRFRQINDAYKVLRNPASRAAYDSGRPEQAREPPKTHEKRGQRGQQTYAEWKQEIGRDFTQFSWHIIGVEDVGQYVRQMEAGFTKAVAAAAASPRDLAPARVWAVEYRGWVASGCVVCVLVTPVVPLVMLACVRLTRSLDDNAEQLLAWSEAPWRAKKAFLNGWLRREWSAGVAWAAWARDTYRAKESKWRD